ncbi:glycolate oxidase iron-sulfur subunit [Desulfitispora alkaliphila]|uniref:(Fe-S)-binding protein n=1 Tax=Desulfitispora alkaliphila TaxID=622674 RepID=UPI003D209CBB
MSILRTDEIYEKLNSCNKCGFCQASCRVYKEVLNEVYTARGRIRLIKAVADGQMERSQFYEEVINSCLLCQECTKTCPSGVPGHKLILAARQDLAKEKGLPFLKKIPLKRVLAKNSLRNISFKYLRQMKNLKGLKDFRGIDVGGMPVAEKSFLEMAKEANSVSNPKGRVAFFVGCMMNHTMVETAFNLITILNANQIEVVVPKEQRCCGTPMNAYGEEETARELAKHNMEVFADLDVDAVITACASCGGRLKEYSHDYGDIAEGAINFSEKVKDITEYLVNTLNIDLSELNGVYGQVTYHDPCHLIRAQGISVEPRKLLADLPGVEFIEMKGASNCCGASGMFQGFYPQLANPITAKKVDSIVNTGASTVVTVCPACRHRIQGSINLSGNKQQVIHIVDLVAEAYKRQTNKATS